MQKAIKVIAGLIGLVIILTIAAIVYLVKFVNPNDFKDQISAKVSAYTGRQLSINGEIKWSFFPWLGLQINQVGLSNAAGFSQKPFAQINQADVKVAVMPLLHGEISIGKLSLQGLQLNLMKNAQGVTNWQDLMAQAKASATNNDDTPNNDTPANNTSDHKFKFNIENVDIRDSNISWQNQVNGQTIKITDLTMSTGKLSPGTAFPLSIQFTLNSNQPAINGNFSLTSDVTGDPVKQTYSLQDLKLTSVLNNRTYANGKLNIALQANVQADLASENLTIDALNAKIANLQIKGNLKGKQIVQNLQLAGQIKIPSVNLKQFLVALGQPLSARQDVNALNLFSADGNLQASANAFKLSALTAQLDETHINGDFAVNDFARKALSFNLNLDQINLNHYLAAPANTRMAGNISFINTAQAATAAPSDNQTLLPIDTLRQLTMQGRLQIGKLQLSKLDADAINMSLKAQNGLINLAPLSARLYQGSYNGSITLDARGKTPLITMDNQLTHIQIEPLTRDLTNITRLQMTGVGNFNMHITTQGNTEPAIIKNLNGKGRLALNDGVLKGINIPYYVRVGRALINRSPLPAQGANQTEFGNLTSTFNMVNGVVSNNDLLLAAPAFQAKGNGNANLVTQYLDYRLVVQLLVTGTQQPQGDAIPLTIRGNFANVNIRPDVEALIKNEAKKQIQTRVTSELQKKLGDQTGKAVGDAVNSFLQQLGQ